MAFSSTELRALADLADVLLPRGHGLPGASEVEVADALDSRVESWEPRVAARVRWLVRAWNLAPVMSASRKRFCSMQPSEQAAWTESCYRSRWAPRRLHVAALKQLIFLAWASSPKVEQALGYDYRCRKDELPRGTAGALGSRRPEPAGPAPHDYHRPGPAVARAAVPVSLLGVSSSARVSDARLSVLTWPEVGDGTRLRADAVVVGSGAGGAVVAATLAEAGLDVVVLEEGEHVTERDFVGPMFDRFQRFCRDNGTTQVWGRPPIPLPLGRVVGGTTVVNSGTCFRAPDRVLNRWTSEFGVAEATASEMAPHYESIEAALSVRPVPWELLGPNGIAAHAGAVALGYSGGPLLRNITDCHGCGQCAFGCPTNAKQAMHISYLPRAQTAGARVLAGCRVDRVVVANGRATGVEATVVDRQRVARGRVSVDARHVVVCAGAIHTPTLLAASRVPDPSRQTGRNLRIHPASGVGGLFDDDITSWKGTLQSYYIDQFFDSHELMFEATTTVPSIGAASMPGIGGRAIRELQSLRRVATLGFYVSDTSKGSVVRLPSGETVARYRLNALDARRIASGLAIAAEVLLAAGARRIYPGLVGIDAISGREDVEQLRTRAIAPAQLRLTAFHPMGTMRMGSDPSSSVVDGYGRHHAVEQLWVADASTFPTCVGVNPQLTVMAFAKRTAERLAAAEQKG